MSIETAIRSFTSFDLKYKSLRSTLAALDQWELIHLLDRTSRSKTEVPKFRSFVNALALWEQARREGTSNATFPDERALVRSMDLYCDSAIDDAYMQFLHGAPDLRGGIHDLLDAVIVLCGEIQAANTERVRT